MTQDGKVVYLAFANLGDQSSSPPLKGGDGGGTSDGMEARVQKLEGQFEKLNEKVDELRIDMAVMKERVGNLPSKGFIVTGLLTSLAVLTAIIIFQDRIATLVG